VVAWPVVVLVASVPTVTAAVVDEFVEYNTNTAFGTV
jgi:hypothetical protein